MLKLRGLSLKELSDVNIEQRERFRVFRDVVKGYIVRSTLQGRDCDDVVKLTFE